MSDGFDMFAALGVEAPKEPTTEDEFFDYLTGKTADKYPRIHNMQYWLKSQLVPIVYMLNDKNWIVSKLSGPTRTQVSLKEISRYMLDYYLDMTFHVRFHGERGKEQKKLLDKEKVLDLVIEYPAIKKLIDDPTILL